MSVSIYSPVLVSGVALSSHRIHRYGFGFFPRTALSVRLFIFYCPVDAPTFFQLPLWKWAQKDFKRRISIFRPATGWTAIGAVQPQENNFPLRGLTALRSRYMPTTPQKKSLIGAIFFDPAGYAENSFLVPVRKIDLLRVRTEAIVLQHEAKGNRYEQQTISPRPRCQHPEKTRRERLLARGRVCLASQDRQRLRCCHSRRDKRAWPHRLHRTERCDRSHRITRSVARRSCQRLATCFPFVKLTAVRAESQRRAETPGAGARAFGLRANRRLRFSLDGTTLRYVPSRPSPSGETPPAVSPTASEMTRLAPRPVVYPKKYNSIQRPSCSLRSFLSYRPLSAKNFQPPETRSNASRFTASLQHRVSETFRRRNVKCLAAAVILRFPPIMTTGPHMEHWTSCVLWPPRIPRDARCPQHAWQGFPPVHPTKEGTGPLCWILPLCVAEAAP